MVKFVFAPFLFTSNIIQWTQVDPHHGVSCGRQEICDIAGSFFFRHFLNNLVHRQLNSSFVKIAQGTSPIIQSLSVGLD